MYPAGIPLDVSKQIGTFVSVQGLVTIDKSEESASSY